MIVCATILPVCASEQFLDRLIDMDVLNNRVTEDAVFAAASDSYAPPPPDYRGYVGERILGTRDTITVLKNTTDSPSSTASSSVWMHCVQTEMTTGDPCGNVNGNPVRGE